MRFFMPLSAKVAKKNLRTSAPRLISELTSLMLEGTGKDKDLHTADQVKQEVQDMVLGHDSEHGALCCSDPAAATRG